MFLRRKSVWGSTATCRSSRAGAKCPRLRREQPSLALVLSIAVFGAGVEVYRMRREQALRLLKAGAAVVREFGG